MISIGIVALLSSFSSGLFLHYDRRTMVFSALAAAAVCAALFLVTLGKLPGALCFAAGLLAATVVGVCVQRRSFADGILFFCFGGCFWGLWTAFSDGLCAFCGENTVLSFFGFFYLLHVPAILLTFTDFSLPGVWKEQMNRENRFHHACLPLLALGLFVSCTLLSALPVERGGWAVLRWLILTGLFWAEVTIPVLLAAYGKKAEQSSAENENVQSMRTFMNIVRSQRHDYNLHVQTVASLIQQEKWEECRNYIQAVTLDTAEMNAILPIKDPAVAALVHNFRMRAQRRGITVLTDIRDDMSRVVTNAYETNKIIGNLLQNALDELEGKEDGNEIELGIYKRGEYCLVRVSNRVSDPSGFAQIGNELFAQGYTTKSGHDGVGLSSIQTLTRRVGGDVSAWLEGDIVHFVASIPMRITTET